MKHMGGLTHLQLVVMHAISGLPARRGTSMDIMNRAPGHANSVYTVLKALLKAGALDRDYSTDAGQPCYVWSISDYGQRELLRTADMYHRLAVMATEAVPPEYRPTRGGAVS